MRFDNTFVPYGAYWSTPFCKWQGTFSTLHPLRFAADCAVRALKERNLAAQSLDALYLGITIPAPHSFFGAPWVAGMISAPKITGPTISQACATSAALIADVALRLENGNGRHETILGITADRTSNGPHLVYPAPLKPGATAEYEDWVWDNFGCDPLGKNSMLETAENVARQEEITTEEQNEVALLRHRQYLDALANGACFHKRYMLSPVEVKTRGTTMVDTDEGVSAWKAEQLKTFRPVLPNGTVNRAGQTYPADGNAGMILTTRDRAGELSRRPEIPVRIVSAGTGRAPQGYMPLANWPAIQNAVESAGIKLADVKAIKTHNPFAVNDIYLARQMKLGHEALNNYGSSLVWGHPQGPTGMRLIMELIEELEIKGGGYGLFSGCAAGDCAMAIVVKVGD